MKQYVDKNRRVRTHYRKPLKKTSEAKTKQKSSTVPRKAHSVQPLCTGMPKMETLGKCSIGLSQYACINNELKVSDALLERDGKVSKKSQRRLKIRQYF